MLLCVGAPLIGPVTAFHSRGGCILEWRYYFFLLFFGFVSRRSWFTQKKLSLSAIELNREITIFFDKLSGAAHKGLEEGWSLGSLGGPHAQEPSPRRLEVISASPPPLNLHVTKMSLFRHSHSISDKKTCMRHTRLAWIVGSGTTHKSGATTGPEDWPTATTFFICTAPKSLTDSLGSPKVGNHLSWQHNPSCGTPRHSIMNGLRSVPG